jgi:serine/threonine protein kinase
VNGCICGVSVLIKNSLGAEQQKSRLIVQVWKVTNLETQEVMAMKVVFWGNPSVKSTHKRILRKEVEALKLLKHPNIVRMTEHLDDDKNLALVLEFLDGGGLLGRLNQVEHYSEAEAAELFKQLLSAVACMHSMNYVHRDIKPENIVFTDSVKKAKAENRRATLKLVDFGLAREYKSTRSVRARLGSPGFMAPEVCAVVSAPTVWHASKGPAVSIDASAGSPLKQGMQTTMRHAQVGSNGVSQASFCTHGMAVPHE